MVGVSSTSSAFALGSPARVYFQDLVAQWVSERDGRLVESTSRDFVAVLPSCAAALETALAVQEAFRSANEGETPSNAMVRIGIDVAREECEPAHDKAIDEARRLGESTQSTMIQISPEVYHSARASLGSVLDPVRIEAVNGDGTTPFASPQIAVATTTARTGSTRQSANTPRRRTSKAIAVLALTIASVVAAVSTLGPQEESLPPSGLEWEPLSMQVTDARVGAVGYLNSLLRKDGTRIQLSIGITNRTEREVELRREEFRLEIDGREVAAIPPLGWKTRFDESSALASGTAAATGDEFQFDRRTLLSGGSAIVGLQFDYPLESLNRDEFELPVTRRRHPFDRWTSGMVVERLGSHAPGLNYRGTAGRLRVDLSNDPFGSHAPLTQPSKSGPGVAVYETVRPVHVFNVHRLWRFVEERMDRDGMPLVVNFQRWPSPSAAVRAFLEGRIERRAHTYVAFVTEGLPTGRSKGFSRSERAEKPNVWFSTEAEATAELKRRSRVGRAGSRRMTAFPNNEPSSR